MRPSRADLDHYVSRPSDYKMSRAEIAVQIIEKKTKKKGKKNLGKKMKKDELDSYKQELNIDDHIISVDDLEMKYNTNIEYGLGEHYAKQVLKNTGPNSLRPPVARSHLMIFLELMFGGFSLLLWIGAILCFSAFVISYINDPSTPYDQIYLGTVISVVVIITGGFGYYQESANMSVMDSFKNMIPKFATVIRGGTAKSIDSQNIVIGDLVMIQGGDCVPADLRILESTTLKVDNSSITGESEPLSKTNECTDVNPLETANLTFFGTFVVEGSGKGVVIACGNDTLMGHIAALTSGLQSDQTPIKKELKKFMQIVTTLAITCGLIFFVVGIIFGRGFIESFIFMIAIIVANLPEGLLVTMTAALTLTAKKMNKKNCMCKNLHAIETLGSTTVICSDKTGTLTQNKMTVAHIYYDGISFDVLGEKHKSNSDTFSILCRVGMLCSRAHIKPGQEKVEPQYIVIVGDASETAVLKCMETQVGNTTKYRADHPKICEIPFNSTNKFQVSIHRMNDFSLLVIKGAPERIIEKCSTILINGVDTTITPEIYQQLESAILGLGRIGERVLGFADFELDSSSFPPDFAYNVDQLNFPLTGLRLIGFMSMIDPPRPGVPDAVDRCKLAGIRVIMVTGDHPVTAMAIARKVNIISEDHDTPLDIATRKSVPVDSLTPEDILSCKAIVVSGTELREMPIGGLDEIIANFGEIVFARTSPQQKLLIVEAFQKAGNVVAVTGDGVNDSPALKKADIGIAMGIAGSDVSKEAADMILLDDNFSSIVVGVEEGRLIFDNLKKSIAYMLTSNMPEMIPFILYFLIEIPLPLSVMAILVIDVGTDLWPGISLAYEGAESDIMLRKPRNPYYDKLVTGKLIMYTNFNIGLIQTIAGLTCYFYTMAEHGFLPNRIIGILNEWLSENNSVLDSYGQEWTAFERAVLHRKCIAAYFLAVVVTQVADCLIVKTRRLSLCQQGMGNCIMNMGLIFEIGVASLVVYCPVLNTIFSMEAISIRDIMPSLPFALAIILFDEGRKYYIRKYPDGWAFRETYY